MEFRPGDTVICIDDTFSGDELSVGKVYTVVHTRITKLNEDLLQVNGSDFSWATSRFKLARKRRKDYYKVIDGPRKLI